MIDQNINFYKTKNNNKTKNNFFKIYAIRKNVIKNVTTEKALFRCQVFKFFDLTITPILNIPKNL